MGVNPGSGRGAGRLILDNELSGIGAIVGDPQIAPLPSITLPRMVPATGTFTDGSTSSCEIVTGHADPGDEPGGQGGQRSGRGHPRPRGPPSGGAVEP